MNKEGLLWKVEIYSRDFFNSEIFTIPLNFIIYNENKKKFKVFVKILVSNTINI